MSIQLYINQYAQEIIKSKIVFKLFIINMIVYLGGYLYYKTNCNYMHINDKHILKKIIWITGIIFIISVILIIISIFTRPFTN